MGSEDEVLSYASRFVQYYGENAKYLERPCAFAERVGIDQLRSVLVEDSTGEAGRGVDGARDGEGRTSPVGRHGAKPLGSALGRSRRCRCHRPRRRPGLGTSAADPRRRPRRVVDRVGARQRQRRGYQGRLRPAALAGDPHPTGAGRPCRCGRGGPAGWGYRGSLRLFGRAAVVVRRGERLELSLMGEQSFVVTVDGSATAAAFSTTNWPALEADGEG